LVDTGSINPPNVSPIARKSLAIIGAISASVPQVPTRDVISSVKPQLG
jgi:hypothetical protein